MLFQYILLLTINMLSFILLLRFIALNEHFYFLMCVVFNTLDFVGNFHKTIQDCSTALELMTPKVQANLDSRSFCICRRGIALCKIGLTEQGKNEIQHALELNGRNDRLQQMAEAFDC